jgi:hypothetical protein
MRTLSRPFLNRKTAAAKTEVTAVEFWSGAAIGQSEIADDRMSACLRRETLAIRLCTMRGEKSSVAPALNVCLLRRKADEIASSSHHDRLSANVRFLQFAILLRRRCPFEVGYPAPIRLSMAYRPKRLTNSGICDARLRADLCPRPCIRCRCRIFDRFALTICTCCLQNTTFRNRGIGFFAKRHLK